MTPEPVANSVPSYPIVRSTALRVKEFVWLTSFDPFIVLKISAFGGSNLALAFTEIVIQRNHYERRLRSTDQFRRCRSTRRSAVQLCSGQAVCSRGIALTRVCTARSGQPLRRRRSNRR